MATIAWKPNTFGGLWTNPSNWVGGVVPGPGDTVLFAGGASNAATIAVGSTVTAASVTLASSTGFNDLNILGTLDLSGTLSVGSDCIVESYNSATFGPGAGVISGGTLDLSGGGSFVGVSANALTLVGAPPAGQAYGFSAPKITGGLTSRVPLLTLAGADFAGTQTVSAVEIDPLTVALSGTVTLTGGTLIRNNPAYLGSGYALTFENDATGGGVLVNDGTIIDTGSLDMYVDLVNAGQISLLGDFDDLAGIGIANSGTTTVGSTEDLVASQSAGKVFANTGLIAVSGGGTLGVVGTLDNDAGTVSLGVAASLAVPAYAFQAAVHGGTVVSAGGTLSGETLDGVTLAGSFANLSGAAAGGTHFVSQTSGVRASATLVQGLSFLADAIVDDVNLTLLALPGSAVGLGGAGGLLLGPVSDVAFAGAVHAGYSWSVTATTGLLLGGTIEAFAGPVYLGAGSGGIVNTGTIRTTAGETLTLGPAQRLQDQMTTFANDGVLQVAAGSVIVLDANVTAAGFAGLTQSGATLDIGGTIDGSAAPGGTITLAAGAVVQTGGLIRDVTVADNTPLTVGGTLDGVTWQGLPLDVSNHGNTVVRNGLSVTNASGGPGTIVVGGTNSILNLQTDTTLDNVNITIGSTLAEPVSDSFSVLDGSNPTLGTVSNLTIGADASVTVLGNDTFDGINNFGTLTIDGGLQIGPADGTSSNDRAFDATGGPTTNDLVIVSGGKVILNPDPQYKAIRDQNENSVYVAQRESADAQAQMDLENSVAYYLTTLSELSHSLRDTAVDSTVSSTATSLDVLGLANENTIAGTGTLSVGNASLLLLNSNVGAGIDLAFSTSTGVVALTDPGNFRGAISGFGPGDAIDLTYLGYAGAAASDADGQLVIATASGTFALTASFAPGYSAADVTLADDAQGGTFAYIPATASTGGGNNSGLPDVSASLPSSVETALQATLASLSPAGTTANAVSVTGGGAAGAAAPGVLNAYVVTSAPDGSTVTVPVGYGAGYLLAGAATLQDTGGNTALIDASANATLFGQNGDTLFGGDADATLIAGAGAETLYGGTGANLLELGTSTALAITQGSDTIVGSTASATVSAAGAPLFFGGSGDTLFNALGTTATLVGGGAETVNANAARVELFGGTGLLTFNAGSGASTVVSGTGGASVTGGSQGLLYFGTGPTTYVAGGAVDTVLGFSGSLTATGGANGTLFFTGTAGGNVVSTGAGSSTIIGYGTGDQLTATGSSSDVIATAGTSATVDGSQSSGSNTFFAFGAGDVVLGGAGLTAIESGLGNQSLTAGSGSTLFEILGGVQNRIISIGNFVAGQDFVQLQGYSAGAGAAALRTASTTGGNEVITLGDGTTITFQNTTNLHANAFL